MYRHPIRTCPNAWCSCPHRTAGEDPRCPDCRRRPASAERHGEMLVTLADGADWSGPWGTHMAHPIPEADRARFREDRAACARAANAMTRSELFAWVKTTGHFETHGEKVDNLRELAARLQIDLWWPRRFLVRAAALMRKVPLLEKSSASRLAVEKAAGQQTPVRAP